MPLLNANSLHPITLPDGSVYRDTVHLKHAITHTRFEIGDFSYFTHSGAVEETASILAPYLFPSSKEKLVIGRYVQIARGSYFISADANHPMDGFTTFPFRIFRPETFGYANLPFRDTVVGNDVWICHNATIMSGVTIGHGAIIAAESVVTRDVPPYAIVGGNPARLIRMRYPQTVIDRLLAIAWWDWPIDKVEANLPLLEQSDIDALEAVC